MNEEENIHPICVLFNNNNNNNRMYMEKEREREKTMKNCISKQFREMK